MRASRKKILVLLLALILLGGVGFVASGYLLYGSPFGYSAEAIEAWVVDAETKAPLEDVIVTANWQLEGGYEGHNLVGQLMVMETVTDSKGRFDFPAWGPKRPWKGALKNSDPQLLFFRSGYEYSRLTNSAFRKDVHKIALRSSRWNAKSIELKRFKGTLEEYAEHLALLNTALHFAVGRPFACEWKKIPRMIVAIHRQKEVFETQKVRHQLFSISRIPARTCGSPINFFEGALQ